MSGRRALCLRTICGASLILLLFTMALVAPLIAPPNPAMSPVNVDLSRSNLPPGSPNHLLGTDHLGRDILSESFWAARASLAVGILAAGLSISFGVAWGSFSAFAGGVIDNLMMRLVDGLLSIPSLILALLLGAYVSTNVFSSVLPSFLLSWLQVTSYSQGLLPLITVVFVVSATTWLEAARLARARVLTIKGQEYVTAAIALGTGTAGVMLRHLLPNAASLMAVEATLLVSEAILMESGLSFLGLGLGPDILSWGGMLASAQVSLLQGNWWSAAVPGLFITLTVFAINLVVEGWLNLTGSRIPRAIAQPAP